MDSVATSGFTERSAVARVAGWSLVASGLLGAFYVGYPVWAIGLGRRLLAGPPSR